MKINADTYNMIMKEGERIIREMFSPESLFPDIENDLGRPLTDQEKDLIKKGWDEV